MTDQSSHQPKIQIFIDKEHFTVHVETMTGAQLRELPSPPIGSDRDLYLEVPGPDDDQLIQTDQVVELKEGMHFFTAPATINPGAHAHRA